MTRHFCDTCGSHVFAYSSPLDEWYVSCGVIETTDPRHEDRFLETTRLVQHEFLSDTKDGGLGPCLVDFQGRPLPFYAQGPDEKPMQIQGQGPSSLAFGETEQRGTETRSTLSQLDNTLHASCHCGGVEYMLSRPQESSNQLTSPWPDLLVPYHSGSPENRDDIKWWLRANGTKYLAGTCACRSCRLSAGFSIQTWAFVPKVNIRTSEDRPWSFDTENLQRYESSPGRYREFCKQCGASAFWHCNERPDLIDVSVGLLRATEGARAESWLQWWTKRVSFRENAIDKALVGALEHGLPNLGMNLRGKA